MTTAKLLLHCPDKPGILAEVTDFITVNKGNIIYLDQYVDHVENIFFMRIEWELKDFLVPQEKIEDYFRTLYGQKYEMDFRLYFSDVKPRMAIFVSKLSHCLFDMLARYTAGEWNVEIPLIISNHPDLQHVAERFGIPFYLFPITKETKEEQERKEMELLAKHKITFIVLARYMQVISEQMINAYPNKIINIHHSFEALASVAADGLDGVVISYSGALTDAARTAEATIAQKLAALGGKTFVFSGNAAFVAAANRDRYTYYLLDATTTENVYVLQSDIDYLTGYLGIPAAKVIPAVTVSEMINDAQSQPQSAASVVAHTVMKSALGGIALSGISGDYYDASTIYPRVKAAIELLNPAHEK